MLKRLFRGGEPSPAATEEERVGLERSLERSRGGLLSAIGGLLGASDITDETWQTLEVALIQSDFGATAAVAMVEELREQARHAGLRRANEVPRLLRRIMTERLESAGTVTAVVEMGEDASRRSRSPRVHVGRIRSNVAGDDASADDHALPNGDSRSAGPRVLLVIGVNGSGKTTTIAKLAHRLRADGQNVLLVAADTFRAAAIDQLSAWAERIDVPIIRGTPGGDPGAVVYDALRSAAASQADVVIIDTAGRLHTQHNLMRELEKVRRVIDREMPGRPDETLLVLDATTGQNGLQQAHRFTADVGVTGLVLAKLDSSAKGGVAFAVVRELGLPIRWVGVGETVDDLLPFDAAAYVDGLLGMGANSAR